MGDKAEQLKGLAAPESAKRGSALPPEPFEPDKLWSIRAGAFRKEIKPYMGYMAMSGFPGFMMLGIIVTAIGYAQLLRHLPDAFPITAVGVILLMAAVCWSPLRTWLLPADSVFLLPREAAMKRYMQRSFRYNGLPGMLGVAAALLVYWPLYTHGNGVAGAWVLLVALAALKAGNIAGAWQERKAAEPSSRITLRLLRWALTALTLAALLRLVPWKAIAFGLLAGLLLAALHRLPRRHRMPWDTLIREEAKTRRRYYRFFSFFIDVPTHAPRIAKRAYLGWIGQRVRFDQHNTYVYMYAMTLVRTELGGMLVRILLLGMLVLYWLGDAVWLDGWGAIAVYVLFAAVIGLQLGTLRQSHKYAVWRHIYPLPDHRRVESLIRVDRTAYLACLLLIWTPACIVLAVHGEWLAAFVPPVAAAAYGFLRRPSALRRKIAKDAELD
ncbi:ABC transporter EcsB [Paenibacillus curdlanolyticus YK9]|uniref:ABC transporter EcsB n=2 Tax=Paenibacillus curdlanolyticus TaxID=59840 RepID=E0I6B6_9BACL|nr:ABC transporter EcsB [Paenibacillus curdlanolyticus YK9]